jgi:hypothetical protein
MGADDFVSFTAVFRDSILKLLLPHRVYLRAHLFFVRKLRVELHRFVKVNKQEGCRNKGIEGVLERSFVARQK